MQFILNTKMFMTKIPKKSNMLWSEMYKEKSITPDEMSIFLPNISFDPKNQQLCVGTRAVNSS